MKRVAIANILEFCALSSLLIALPAMAATFSSHSSSSSSTSSSTTTRRHVVSYDRASSNDDNNIIGIQSGLGIANASISVPQGLEANPTSSRTRLNFGGYFEHRFIPYFGLRLEFDYVQRGFSTSDGQGQGALVQDKSANYLEFPLFAKAQYKVGIFTPYVLAGPFLGVLVGSGNTVSQGGQSQDVPENGVNSTNFGLNFGGGAMFEVVRHFNLEIGARYSMGLTNVSSLTVPGESIKLNSFQILSGVAVSL